MRLWVQVLSLANLFFIFLEKRKNCFGKKKIRKKRESGGVSGAGGGSREGNGEHSTKNGTGPAVQPKKTGTGGQPEKTGTSTPTGSVSFLDRLCNRPGVNRMNKAILNCRFANAHLDYCGPITFYSLKWEKWCVTWGPIPFIP